MNHTRAMTPSIEFRDKILEKVIQKMFGDYIRQYPKIRDIQDK